MILDEERLGRPLPETKCGNGDGDGEDRSSVATTATSSSSSTLSSKVSDNYKKKDDDNESEDVFCRVCRCKGTLENPLRHPCKCKGSVKWIHEECLGEWLKHSRKYECELCGYKYAFRKEYTNDAPENLTVREIVSDLFDKLDHAILSATLSFIAMLFNWVVDPFLSSWTMHIFLEIDFHIDTSKILTIIIIKHRIIISFIIKYTFITLHLYLFLYV